MTVTSIGAGRAGATMGAMPDAVGTPGSEESPTSEIAVVPANNASWDDLVAVLGSARCHGGPCFCQRFKIPPAQWRSSTADDRAARLREETHCEKPGARWTCGLVAYRGDVPVGWCRVEPRNGYAWLGQTPWIGRNEDRADDTVWAVSCFIVRPEHRRRGVISVLTRSRRIRPRSWGPGRRGLSDGGGSGSDDHLG